jgi:hypothetical protein
MTTKCTCPTHDGRRLARIPWSTPTRSGCPVHPASEVCTAVHRRLRSSSSGEAIDTPCRTRLDDTGVCPNAADHADAS